MGFGAIDSLKTLVLGTDAEKVYGRKPNVPKLKTAADAQKEALAANQANFADIAKLATQTNTLNQEQLNRLIDMTLGPGVREQFQKNLVSQARGEIPDDVRNAIYRGNAERSASGNAFGGGGFSRNVNARDLGLTSLQITNNALSSAEQWLNAAKAPTFDAMGMFGISTAQQYAANTDQFNRDLLAEKIAAAPDPAARGVFDSNMALAGMILSAYSGGAGYQGTYRGGQDAQPLAQTPAAQSYYMPQTYQAPTYQVPYNSNGMYPGGSGGLGNDTALASTGRGGGLGGLAGMFA